MKGKFAVFDIDGTLIRWQLFHAVLNTLAKQGYLGKSAYDEIRKARFRWKQRAHQDAFKDYERTLVGLYYRTLKSIPVDKFDEAIAATVDEYKDQAYIYTRTLIKNLKKQNYTLLAISGSHQRAVAEVAKKYGFDDWVGSTIERKDNKFTGKGSAANENKNLVLEGLVKKHGLNYKGSIGVGDTASDISFLELIETPIAFNPNSDLYKYAKRKNWKIVVERKNVIYELEAEDGKYVLAETKT